MSMTRNLAKAHEKGRKLLEECYSLDLNAEEIGQAYKYYNDVEKEQGHGWGLFSVMTFMFIAGLHFGSEYQKRKLRKSATSTAK